MSSGSFKKWNLQNVFTNHIYLIYMYKLDLAINNLQRLICHKTNHRESPPATLQQRLLTLQDA